MAVRMKLNRDVFYGIIRNGYLKSNHDNINDYRVKDLEYNSYYQDSKTRSVTTKTKNKLLAKGIDITPALLPNE